MRKLFIIFSILLFALFFEVTLNFGQSKSQIEKVIKIEVTLEKNSEFTSQLEVPIDFSNDGTGFGFGGRSYCNHCDDKFAEYEFSASAWQRKKDKFLVTFTYIYPRQWKGCNFEKVFIVQKDKPSEMQVKCGVKLKAYYAEVKKEE